MTALQRAGAVVRKLSSGDGLPDLLVAWRGSWSLLECKAPEGPKGGKSRKGQKLNRDQQLFRVVAKVVADCEVYVVRSPEEALDAIGVSAQVSGRGRST